LLHIALHKVSGVAERSSRSTIATQMFAVWCLEKPADAISEVLNSEKFPYFSPIIYCFAAFECTDIIITPLLYSAEPKV